MRDIQTSNGSFEVLRKNDYLYVDKTRFLYDLIQNGNMFLCSRPRRFGKSLAISTLEAIFQGKRELFKGLFIDSADYGWKTYPVVHIDFGWSGKSTSRDLDAWLKDRVREIAESYGVTGIPEGVTSAEQFSDLIASLASRHGQVVVLVDEYDKVVNDNADKDVETVTELRETLRAFYAPIKTLNRYIRFAFITGVTRLTMAGIFGGLNNLNDISMDSDYATMMGYTQQELETNFADYIELGMRETGLDRETYLGKMREMYGGYRFEKNSPPVYNPVSVGLFFFEGGACFNNYWFETGGNTRLVMNVAKEVDFNRIIDLEEPVSSDSFSNFEITALYGPFVNQEALKWLLYQTGYLTIDHAECEFGTTFYHLAFPNQEVERSFREVLSRIYARYHG